MMQWLRGQMRRKGQSMVEFALILVLVAVVAMVAIVETGNQLSLTYMDVLEALTNPSDPGSTSPYPCPGGLTATLHGHRYHCQ